MCADSYPRVQRYTVLPGDARRARGPEAAAKPAAAARLRNGAQSGSVRRRSWRCCMRLATPARRCGTWSGPTSRSSWSPAAWRPGRSCSCGWCNAWRAAMRPRWRARSTRCTRCGALRRRRRARVRPAGGGGGCLACQAAPGACSVAAGRLQPPCSRDQPRGSTGRRAAPGARGRRRDGARGAARRSARRRPGSWRRRCRWAPRRMIIDVTDYI